MAALAEIRRLQRIAQELVFRGHAIHPEIRVYANNGQINYTATQQSVENQLKASAYNGVLAAGDALVQTVEGELISALVGEAIVGVSSLAVLRAAGKLPIRTLEAAGDTVSVSSNKPFALEIDQHLDDFAKSFGADTWKSLDDVSNWKPQVLDKILDPKQKVLVNLDGVDIWGGVTRAASGRGGATDWELLQIKQNSQSWDTIDFYQNGVEVGNSFK